MRDVLEQKCAYKGIAIPTFEALLPHRADLESMWQSMLGHQLPSLPPVDTFWDALPEIFAWLMEETEVPKLTRIAASVGEIAVRGRVLPMAVPMRSRPALEVIRFAAANQLCVDLAYDNRVRRIEPYSLRQTAEGNFVLHAIRAESGEHRSYRVDRIQGVSVTSQAFTPRYLLELTPSGPLPVGTTPLRNEASTSRLRNSPGVRLLRRSAKSGATGPTYIYRCTVCGKSFERKSMDGSLNPHKHPRGYPCPGSIGVYVRTKF